ncbi:GNAT family N-acetyltransferase [Scytonema sp. UIC 10036]|uniref:GNAT family N-acetyltransferase n=1 Tax=Scytonema sp. UIC 10036 TaxID=2304196 RepID=UPI0012DA9A17|nr:GNAT family N-acetyltransferase [Scytonema sp. UIC 10036]MUG95762.1 GNAT family N-acetyltransferase [Scytonema sp. UIC 10036]
MTAKFEYSQVTDREDAQKLKNIIAQCFIALREDTDFYFNCIGLENFRLIRRDRQIAGGLATIPMSQWWGGSPVPTIGLAAVGIAPEHRGDGSAIALLQHTLKECHTKGVPISALYPATQRLYRKAGYEQGGFFCSWEISTNSIQIKEQPLPLLAVSPEEEAFHNLYPQKAKFNNGYLDRHQAIWQQIIKPDNNETVYAYLIGTVEQPQGYIIFSQHQDRDGSFIKIRDWVVLTPKAAQTVWSFLANHRSQIQSVHWKGSPIDTLTLLLPEQTAQQKSTFRWMLRIVDVAKALEKRGYFSATQTELHLDIKDDLLPENNGKFILSVANGQGEVRTGGKGEMKLDIKGLAPLYTGLYTPYQLQQAAYLDATETALLAATQIFAGASPSMSDFF